ncbi:hypothetical protein SISNIDRAFT_441474 [Sistotremastrum niveocremeum HHB9708]|uniref:T6SS Phospholipase effector Tle1-like catalytic domain-containing protein n=1 Tax=Sistotremastrum niveocremeum HHB9708 TaxID=1314777 RepID=A0A164UVD8_9AGAM|nr:hypothetical protein SISNIDRAFT_441474 [Sistotremastrum niveocremeum HHB9708]
MSSLGELPIEQGRNLVLCFDGTDAKFRSKNTNVVKFFGLLQKENVDRQMCYYQAGIGTYVSPGMVSPLTSWLAKVADEAVAWYLDHHVMGGYRFLMQNYRAGDKICLFGFSRGAYTARALAAMLYSVGLLPQDNQEQIAFAYAVYKKTGSQKTNKKTNSGDDAMGQARKFKQTFCRPVIIEFVGCWDTVASTGLLMSKTLPFVSSNTAIRVFRHALSLDEHRVKYIPNTWHRTAPTPTEAARDPQKASYASGYNSPHEKMGHETRPETDVLEVWFAGCHSDVGGGNQPSEQKGTLSTLTLSWMVHEVMASQCGILFDETYLAQAGIAITAQEPTIHPRLLRTSESDNSSRVDHEDTPSALHDGTLDNHKLSESNARPGLPSTSGTNEVDAFSAPITDSLKSKPWWWILELLPLRRSWQDENGAWHWTYVPNLGRGREIHVPNPNFSVSVKERMNDPKLKYKPRARYHGEPRWVSGNYI